MLTYRNLENKLLVMRGVAETDLLPRAEAQAAFDTHRSAHGFIAQGGKLLSVENAKLHKGEGIDLIMLALSPADSSGTADICPMSTAGCRKHCVAYSGNGLYRKVQRARMARTDFLVENPTAFLSLLVHLLDAKAAKGRLGVRLNGFSDIRWERVLPGWFWQRYADVVFYDYTKHSVASRPVSTMPANYKLTYSITERSTDAQVTRELEAGRNVAAVVSVKGGKLRGKGVYRELPSVVGGVDGDENDRRFDDAPGSVVLLRRKGGLPVTDPLVVTDERLHRLFGSDK